MRIESVFPATKKQKSLSMITVIIDVIRKHICLKLTTVLQSVCEKDHALSIFVNVSAKNYLVTVSVTNFISNQLTVRVDFNGRVTHLKMWFNLLRKRLFSIPGAIPSPFIIQKPSAPLPKGSRNQPMEKCFMLIAQKCIALAIGLQQ